MNTKLVISGAIVALLLGLNTTAQAKNGMALTWQAKTPQQLTGSNGNIGGQHIVVVGCQKKYKADCKPYTGDTSIKKKRRILCIVPGKQPEPAVYATQYPSSKDFYYNWSGAKIGLTKRVKGIGLTQAKADRICRRTLRDKRARMLEHHDNKVGGWNVGGFMHPNSKAQGQLLRPWKKPKNKHRYWVRIKNQPANPWNN